MSLTSSMWHFAPANGMRHTPPTALAFGEPDDRLRRGIQYIGRYGQAHRFGILDRPLSRTMTALHEDPLSSSSSPQIHFDHPLVRRNLIDGSFGQHRALVQAGHLDAELADKGHVMFDDHDR